MSARRAAIIIPTYEEEENLKRLIPRLEETTKSLGVAFHIFIVDDSPTEATAKIARKFAREYGNITIIRRGAKLGLGSAYIEGFRLALKLGYDYVFEMDADLSHDPIYLSRILKRLDKCDVVIGSRYISGGGTKNWPIYRVLISKIANLFARFVLNIRDLQDVTSGYRGYRAEILKRVNLKSIKSSGYAFQVEVLHRCLEIGASVCEVPIVFVERAHGKSKLSKGEIFNFIKSVILLKLRPKIYSAKIGHKFASFISS